MADEKPKTPKKSGDKKKTESKISNTEWGMVIGALFIIDIIQVCLNLIGIPFLASIGTIVNRFIDVAVGLAWPTYLKLRGVNLNSIKVMSIGIAFIFEMIPGIDALPLWGLDGLYMLFLVKAEEKLKEKTGVDVDKAAALTKPGPEKEGGGGEGSENGPDTSDEYADAVGQENDERDEGGSENAMSEEDKEGGEEHETSDEDSDELGKESDKKPDENKTPEEKEKDKSKGKKKTRPSSGGIMGGNRNETINQSGSDKNSSDLDLRNGNSSEGTGVKSSPIIDNILDLSLSYGERKKRKAAEQE